MKELFKIIGLKTEYAENPINVFTRTPRFSWRFEAYPGFRQRSYRVTVSSSLEALESGIYDMWDSRTIESSCNVGVQYGGVLLKSRDCAYWKCFVTDQKGVLRQSAAAYFEVALLEQSDWHGCWQAAPASPHGGAQYWRKAFELPDKPIVRARVYVCGLGYHEFYVNGTKVGEDVLNPGVTDYSKQVLYCTYDITSALTSGGNCFGFILGYGWFGARKLLMQAYVDFEDGTYFEDYTEHTLGWWVSGGPITSNSIYGGETYDARLEEKMEGWATYPYRSYFDNGWVFSVGTDAPSGELVSQTVEPIRVVEDCPANMIYSGGGRSCYDFSVNLSGWVRIKVKGKRGTVITIKHAECMSEDGKSVDTLNLRTAAAEDVYILKGEGIEEYEPRFTYHGFRFAEILTEGGAELLEVTGRFVRSSVKRISEFECSDQTLNILHRNAVNTEGANLHSIMTDCPQRDERCGWLNDIASRHYQQLCNYDMAKFYPKFVRDITETQNEEGMIADTAPFHIGKRPADPVSVSYLLLGLKAYRAYGDRRILEDNYAGFKAWTEYLKTRAKDDLLEYSYYGDWVAPYPPESQNTPEDAKTPGNYISAAYYYWHTTLLEEIAGILGNNTDSKRYGELSERIKKAFNARFYNKERRVYGTDSQTCNSVALSLGLCPAQEGAAIAGRVADNIAKFGYHSTAGNQGYRHLFYALADKGYNDLLHRMLINPEYPGWGYTIACGAVSVWERWEKTPQVDMHSFNHPMFGSYDGWLFNKVAGIELADDAVGADKLVISPSVLSGLSYVRAKIETVNGVVSSAWEKSAVDVKYSITIPANTQADIVIDGDVSKMCGEVLSRQSKEGKTVLCVYGGSYTITAAAKPGGA